jgi:U3 small nucleolar RNA-associated protein 20
LWSAATHALASLSERFGDIVWDLIFKDVRHLCQIDELSDRLPSWASTVSDADNDEEQEEEITWRDPSAHKMRVAVIKWTSDNVSRRDLIKA